MQSTLPRNRRYLRAIITLPRHAANARAVGPTLRATSAAVVFSVSIGRSVLIGISPRFAVAA